MTKTRPKALLKFWQDNPLITILAVIAAGLAIIQIVSLITSTSHSPSLDDIPKPANSAKLDFGLEELKKAPHVADDRLNANETSVEAYHVKGVFQKEVVDFYIEQLKNQGWEFVDTETCHYFRKDKEGLVVGASPVEQGNLTTITNLYPQLKSQLQLNDVFFILVRGPFDQLNGLCG